MITVTSTPNIAFIKYWGNRHQELRLPTNDSLSMTLDSPIVEVSIEETNTFSVTSNKELTKKDQARLKIHRELAHRYLTSLQPEYALPTVSVSITSQVPAGIGLASSAAIFSGITKAYAELLAQKGVHLTNEQVSIMARLGSGSACRSIHGGFVAIHAGLSDSIDAAIAVQIADEHHWKLHNVVIAPSLQEKKYGSSEGHQIAHTSPFFTERLQKLSKRQQECIDAICHKDFEKLQHVTEEDAWNMHKIAETSTPSLCYLTQETYRITQEVAQLRTEKHLPVLFTMDAGPTVHLICTEEACADIREYAHQQTGCAIFETKVGTGAQRKAAKHETWQL